MRIEKTCVRARRSLRCSAALLMLGSVAACSGDAVRFTDNFYTASIPSNPRPKADLSTVSPVATASQQRAAIAASYPGNATQMPAPAAAGGNVSQADPFATGSVAQTQANPVYNGIGRQAPIQSQTLAAPQTTSAQSTALTRNGAGPAVTPPPATAPTAVSPPPAPDAKPQVAQVSPAELVDTSKVQNRFIMEQSAGTDPMTTQSVNQPDNTLKRAEGWTRAGGTYVSVRPGETIYNMAKRYGVPANAIMEANSITDPAGIGVGQRILIPTYVYSRSTPVSAPDADSNVRSASSVRGSRSEFGLAKAPYPTRRPQQLAMTTGSTPQASAKAPRPETRPSASGGRYVVQSGDSLYAISRRTGASLEGIRRVNGLSGDMVRMGQTLIIPGANTAELADVSGPVSGVDPMTTSVIPARRPQTGYQPPSAESSRAGQDTNDTATGQSDTQLASIDRNDTQTAPAATGVAKMRWPASGRIVTAFKANDGGVPNEGIDISVPIGTPVKAAENGVVIYSGDGLKELGKTVLVRHGDGMVTVYGHADNLNVKRGDAVKRGQVIASSGMSGNAKKPKLHFEVRKNTTAIDPLTVLD